MADDGDVLGNLPRSRPGHRSEKRSEKTAAQAADRVERSEAEASKPAPEAAKPAPEAAKPPPEAAKPAPVAQPDPLGDAIRTVSGVAATGARVAGGVAREVLRRLPRP